MPLCCLDYGSSPLALYLFLHSSWHEKRVKSTPVFGFRGIKIGLRNSRSAAPEPVLLDFCLIYLYFGLKAQKNNFYRGRQKLFSWWCGWWDSPLKSSFACTPCCAFGLLSLPGRAKRSTGPFCFPGFKSREDITKTFICQAQIKRILKCPLSSRQWKKTKRFWWGQHIGKWIVSADR